MALTRLTLPLGIVSCRVVPRAGKVGSKQAKCPTPAGTPEAQETSPRDSVPPKQRRKMGVLPVSGSDESLTVP